jgi:hypothetical protein
MAKLVILMLQEGNFEQGFQALLQIRGDDPPTETQIQIPGSLPAAPEIAELLHRWRSNFKRLPTSRLEAISTQVVAPDPQVAAELADRLNEWLNSGDKQWRGIRDVLMQNTHEQIRILLETEDVHLRRLPWHSWDLFVTGNYKKTDIAFSPRSYQRPQGYIGSSKTVKILAVFGYARHLQLDLDRTILEQLRDREAEITILKQPSPEELRQRLRQESWHIFFFAGHSQSDANGEIGWFKLNETESIAIADLKNSLDIAINEHGLQLAIFNSCDGLGLANQLAQLHLPQSIVMREPVPDEVATKFLQEFLRAFANNESFCASVRYARGVLEDAFHQQYPGVSWLPVICQNPAIIPPTWQQWLNPVSSLDLVPEVAPEFVEEELSNYQTTNIASDSAKITPKIAIKLGIYLAVISTLSLLGSYVGVKSEPWIQAFGSSGWIVELARAIMVILGIIYIVASKFPQETGEFFAFHRPLKDPYGILSSFRVFVGLFSLAIAGLLLDHHLFTGPQALGADPDGWSISDFVTYRLPYLLYFPYSTINYGLAVWIFGGGSYAAINDLLYLREKSLKIKNQLAQFTKKSIKNDTLPAEIINIFHKYCYEVIDLTKRYTSMSAPLASLLLFEVSLGKNTLSEPAIAWVWVGIIVVAIVLLIIFWGFSHYETVFQETSHCLSRFQVNYTEFERENNSVNFLKRICRANLSLYIALVMLSISLSLIFWPIA